MGHDELPRICFRLLESLDAIGILELLDGHGCPIPVSELVEAGTYSEEAEFLCRARKLVSADRHDGIDYLTLTGHGAEALARHRVAGGVPIDDRQPQDAPQDLPAGPAAKPSEAATIEAGADRLEASVKTKSPKLRVKVHAETKVVEIDGTPFPLSGSDKRKQQLVEFIQALIDAQGAPVSATDYGIRSRDVERQHDKIKSLIGDDAKPGSGYRIPLEKLMA